MQAPNLPAAPALRTGQRCVVRIEDIAFGGEGVGRVDGFVVFVPFVLVGETVELELTEVKKNFARGRLVRVVEASPERVAPRCRYFGDCGGCQYQHVAYAAQLRIKHQQVASLFQRLGGLDPAVVAPVVPCPQPYGYRNRIMVRSQWDKFRQALNLGFVRHDNRLVVDVEECPIAEPAFNAQLRQVRAQPPPKGGLKVVLRAAPEGWEVPPDSFFQNNFFLLPRLVEVARDFLRRAGTRHLVDAYCGVGFFALELADAVDRYVGIEYDQRAIAAARRNAAARGRVNGEFIAGRTEEWLAGAGETVAAGTTVLVDPPRKGCSPRVLELLRRMRPAQVILVSCHPATLARDLNALGRAGVFDVVSVVPLDMFPQTQHIECVADARLRAASAAPPPVKTADSPALSNV